MGLMSIFTILVSQEQTKNEHCAIKHVQGDKFYFKDKVWQ